MEYPKFYGIFIRMYFARGEHPPPHFHVYSTRDGICNPVRNVLCFTSGFKGYTKRKRRGFKPRRASD
ncbi:MAG: DUF4160 domain-containing protein [Candidatus Methylumidiphilus sp.]